MADAILNTSDKCCTKCGVTKAITEFSSRKDRSCGHRRECRECVRQYARTWRGGKGDTIKSYLDAFWSRHPERRAQYYNRLAPEKRREYQRRYYAKNREEIINRVLQSIKENPAKDSARTNARRTKKLLACPMWADMDRIQAFYDTAARMAAETGVKWHVDHVVPLQSALVCGLHVECNLAVITAAQNISKGNRRWPDMP